MRHRGGGGQPTLELCAAWTAVWGWAAWLSGSVGVFLSGGKDATEELCPVVGFILIISWL